MDTPPPTDPLPPEPPLVLPAADLPPLDPATGDPVPVLGAADDVPVLLPAGPPPKPPIDTRTALFLAVLGVGAVAYVLLLVAGGPARDFASAGVQVLPFLGLSLLAYAGERSDTFRLLTVIYWGLLVVTAVLFMILVTGAAEANLPVLIQLRDAGRAGKKVPVKPSDLFLPNGLLLTALTGLFCFAAALVAASGYAPGVRRAMARVVPGFDAESFVHAVALSTVAGLALVLLIPLAVTGEPPPLVFVRHVTDPALGPDAADLEAMLGDKHSMLWGEINSLIWLVPVGLVAVGWPLHRTLPAALRRVGFVVPKAWHVPFGLGLAAVLALVMAGGVDPAIGRLWARMNWPRTDETTFEVLMKALTNPLGAVVIAVVAGVGEELFARGILQPRLGIVLSNLFFTALHALQYNWDGLLSVFLIGLVLGVVRKKTNTTASAVVHGTYDFLLVMAAYRGIDPSKWFGW